jgi:hypothetical protein
MLCGLLSKGLYVPEQAVGGPEVGSRVLGAIWGSCRRPDGFFQGLGGVRSPGKGGAAVEGAAMVRNVRLHVGGIISRFSECKSTAAFERRCRHGRRGFCGGGCGGATRESKQSINAIGVHMASSQQMRIVTSTSSMPQDTESSL